MSDRERAATWSFPDLERVEFKYPEPEVACREAAAIEIPRGANVIIGLCAKGGWTHKATYAKGSKPHARTNAPLAVVESITVRFARGDVKGWASWVVGKFDSAQILRPTGIAINANLTEVKGQLQCAPTEVVERQTDSEAQR